MAENPIVSISHLNKWYGDFHVLRDIDLAVGRGERIVICGPSGSGKSTLIRCINALEEFQEGEINVDGIDLGPNLKRVDEVRREVGMVFQSFNLFPHMSVLENVTLAPRRVLGQSKAEAEAEARRLLGRFGLAERGKEYPDRLSGGQQQRVAIVRALAMNPKLMLLDEITSALDPQLVADVLNLVRELAEVGMTMIIATHEMSFAREVADKICFLDSGRILEEGPPAEIFTSPHEARTREFLARVLEAGRM